ncbi:hypothetical protein Pcac1_g27092 [Phytophthora cactorum]|nr:hypothetical protein Pcac1_g27092 [Phytophthora cactorum]KAG2818158.1 hypothetical protein PC111_g12408 [Phytophthora cactorum]KAG3016595.1 hypothetical protein PC120_g11514 [Phytophthora cactorum]KAG4053521.1 hypothetical protein PC123_g11331 [Phytophthora cactorum]
MSPVQHPRTKFSGTGSLDPLALVAARRRRKETVNERVEHILRGALRDAEEEALQEREGDPETRGRALQRSRQLASLYTTSTDSKFLRSRAKRDASLEKTKHDSEGLVRSKTEPEYAGSVIGEGNESDASDEDSVSGARMVLASPIKLSVSSQSPVSISPSPLKPAKPWYGSSPTATLKQQLPPGITLDAKLRRYGARGTAKLLHGWRSQEALEPLSPNHSLVPIDEFVSGVSGSPSLWPPETFHPSGSRLRVTMTRCPSSPIAVSVEVPNAQNVANLPCQHVEAREASQQKATQKLQKLYKQEKKAAREEQVQNQRSMSEWQSRTLHFEPSSELVAHREQQKADRQLRHRRTQASAIVQTPGYSPEKQRSKESSELYKKRFKLRWRSFAQLLDAMRRTPCRRPVLQDMEKLFALARELGALNALGTCTLSRSQFTQLITREFPLCELKHVNRLFSCYDWEIRDSVDTRIVLGTLRAMRVQQGESVELICASLRDFDGTTDSNGKNGGDNEALVSDGVSLIKALSLCCGSDEEEKDMEARADAIWTTTLSWQRQILSRRLHGGMWKPKQVTWSVVNSSTVSRNSGDDDTLESVKDADDDDEEDTKEDTPELMRLVDESRVPVRRIREALKREQDTLALFTQQLLQRRHECLVGANTCSPRT